MMIFRMSPNWVTPSYMSKAKFNPYAGSCGCESVEDQKPLAVTWHPAADIYETPDAFVLKLELAGVPKEAVNVEFKDSILTISGERKDDTEIERSNYVTSERHSGKFFRSFRFPENIDGHKIEASLKNGILEVTVAKPEEQKPRTIDINKI